MVRCPSEREYMDWLRSLYTQVKCSPAVNYIRPAITSPPNTSNPLVIIDIGSCSIRAGLLGISRMYQIILYIDLSMITAMIWYFTLCAASYPQLFFPTTTTTEVSGKRIFGKSCYAPENRSHGLHNPIKASQKNIDSVSISAICSGSMPCVW